MQGNLLQIRLLMVAAHLVVLNPLVIWTFIIYWYIYIQHRHLVLRMKLEWSTKTWNSCATTGEHPWMVNGKDADLNWIDLQIPSIWRFKKEDTGFGYFTSKWNPTGNQKEVLVMSQFMDSTFKFWHESSMSPLGFHVLFLFRCQSGSELAPWRWLKQRHGRNGLVV